MKRSLCLSLISALSLSLFVSLSLFCLLHRNSWVLLISHRASVKSPDSTRGKGNNICLSAYFYVQKTRGEETQRSTEDTRLLRGCRIRKSKLPLEDERGNTPFLSDPPAWSHLTCTFGLKSRVMSQLPCASQR